MECNHFKKDFDDAWTLHSLFPMLPPPVSPSGAAKWGKRGEISPLSPILWAHIRSELTILGGGDIPPRLSRKLSAVARRARRRWKAHVKTHLMHVLHYKIKVTCKVKVRLKVKNTVFFAFWAVESVR